MTFATEVLADSPWGFWEQAETTGSTLADSSGNSRPLSITGAATLAQTGPDGTTANAIAWPSSASTENYAKTAATLGTSVSSIAVECWFYLSATPTANTALVAVAYGYGNNSLRPYHLFVESDGHVSLCSSDNSAGPTWKVKSSAAVALNTWHHVVGTTDTSTGTLIRLDKSTVASSADMALVDTTGMGFIHGGGTPDSGIGGVTNSSAVTVAYPAIYLASLSTTRIDAHYDAMGISPTLNLSETLPALVDSLTLRSYTRTDTSNGWSGRIRGGYAIHADNTDPVILPAAAATRRDKALWYPEPELVDGRPVSPPPVSESSVIPQTIPFTIGAS